MRLGYLEAVTHIPLVPFMGGLAPGKHTLSISATLPAIWAGARPLKLLEVDL